MNTIPSRLAAMLAIITLLLAACPQASAAWKPKKKNKDNAENKNKPQKEPASKTNPKSTADFERTKNHKPDPAADARVRELIGVIESHPSGVVIINNGEVQAPPDHQPFNPDGTRNENFTVTPDPTQGLAAMQAKVDSNRNAAVQELIGMGPKSVDELSRALVNDSLEFRSLYAYALGEIKDPRAVPALIKYMDDAFMKAQMAPSLRSIGDEAKALALEDEANKCREEAASALKKITGLDYGTDLARWKDWWEKNKDKAGPLPNIKLYDANPAPPKVHFDPALMENQTSPK